MGGDRLESSASSLSTIFQHCCVGFSNFEDVFHQESASRELIWTSSPRPPLTQSPTFVGLALLLSNQLHLELLAGCMAVSSELITLSIRRPSIDSTSQRNTEQ